MDCSASDKSPLPVRLTELSVTGGCGCKIAPARLAALLRQSAVLPAVPPAELLAGAAHAEDAAVWKISESTALVATVDFFAPMVDSPFDYGRIAAANAISDIYAMGARPLFALALAAMPESLPDSVIAEIFAGGAECCRAAAAVVAGGHTILAKEPHYGMAVVGQISPARVLTNGGACLDDVLILGKPLGAGLLAAAARRGELAAADAAQMINNMTLLNKAGARMPDIEGVHAMTDVTGFGLCGHLLEMCRASDCAAVLHFADVPLQEAATALAQAKRETAAGGRNWQSYGAEVSGVADDWRRIILTDPQTNGGLLIACAPAAAAAVLDILREEGCTQAAVIGRVQAGAGVFVK